MLKFKATIAIVVIMVLLIAYVLLIEIKNPTKEEREEQEKVVFKIEDTEKIKSLSFDTKDEDVVCEKIENEWYITSPLKAKGDEGIFNGMLANLAELKSEAKLEESMEDLSAYGLDVPSSTVTITFEDGKKEIITIGNKTFDDSSYYAQVGEEKKTVTLPSYTVDGYFLKPMKDLRDRTFITFNTDEVTDFDFVHEGETVKCQKEGAEKWNILSPVKEKGDFEKINSWLSSVGGMRVQDFLNNTGEVDLALYGLDKPSVDISLLIGEDKAKKALAIGQKTVAGDGYYAKRADNPEIFILPASAVESLYAEPASAWIDTHVYEYPFGDILSCELREGDKILSGTRDEEGKWMLSKPEAKEATEWKIENQIRSVINLKAEKTLTAKPEECGFDKPRIEVKVTGKDSKEAILLIGKETGEGSGEFYAQKKGDKKIFPVTITLVESLSEIINNPPYRENEEEL